MSCVTKSRINIPSISDLLLDLYEAWGTKTRQTKLILKMLSRTQPRLAVISSTEMNEFVGVAATTIESETNNKKGKKYQNRNWKVKDMQLFKKYSAFQESKSSLLHFICITPSTGGQRILNFAGPINHCIVIQND